MYTVEFFFFLFSRYRCECVENQFLVRPNGISGSRSTRQGVNKQHARGGEGEGNSCGSPPLHEPPRAKVKLFFFSGRRVNGSRLAAARITVFPADDALLSTFIAKLAALAMNVERTIGAVANILNSFRIFPRFFCWCEYYK